MKTASNVSSLLRDFLTHGNMFVSSIHDMSCHVVSFAISTFCRSRFAWVVCGMDFHRTHTRKRHKWKIEMKWSEANGLLGDDYEFMHLLFNELRPFCFASSHKHPNCVLKWVKPSRSYNEKIKTAIRHDIARHSQVKQRQTMKIKERARANKWKSVKKETEEK